MSSSMGVRILPNKAFFVFLAFCIPFLKNAF